MSKKSPLLIVSISVLCFLVIFIGILTVTILLIERGREREDSELQTFANCNQLREYTNKSDSYPYYFGVEDSVSQNSESGSDGGDSKSVDFSGTNIQVEGVDEADIVKTNGESLFVYSGESSLLNFLDVSDPANPVLMDTIDYYTTYNHQLYLHNNLLVVMYTSYDFEWEDRGNQFISYYDSTFVDIYDVSDLSNVSKQETIGLDGQYINSRFIDGRLYLVTDTFSYSIFSSGSEDPQLPSYQIGESGVEKMADCNEISILGNNGSNFIGITSVDIENIDDSINFKVLLGNSNQMYMSSENLYLTSMVYEEFKQGNATDLPLVAPDILPRSNVVSTEIIRLSLNNGDIDFEAKGSVDGSLLNQFSLDEYYGTLRVATTTTQNETANNLYILDENLEQLGSIENLAEGETIFSVRFMGERAYVVTFRQVDPLFAIDLSNPTDPKVTGELKIPGFSNYLHPVSENTLLGIGKEATENGRIVGFKVSLFDVSDSANPVVKDEVVFDGNSTESEATSNHKSVLFDAERELLSIPLDIYDYNDYTNQSDFTGFVVFNINDESIEERGRVDFDSASTFWYYSDSRSLYIGEYLLMYKAGILKVVDFETLESVSELNLSKYDYDRGAEPFPSFLEGSESQEFDF